MADSVVCEQTQTCSTRTACYLPGPKQSQSVVSLVTTWVEFANSARCRRVTLARRVRLREWLGGADGLDRLAHSPDLLKGHLFPD